MKGPVKLSRALKTWFELLMVMSPLTVMSLENSSVAPLPGMLMSPFTVGTPVRAEGEASRVRAAPLVRMMSPPMIVALLRTMSAKSPMMAPSPA
jgi:hypothetical protein